MTLRGGIKVIRFAPFFISFYDKAKSDQCAALLLSLIQGLNPVLNN